MLDHDVRLQLLEPWLQAQLHNLYRNEGWGQVPEGTLTPASSDASFRRYFRWAGAGRSFIVMDAPPPQENCTPFVNIAALLASADVHVPTLHAQDLDRGFLLLSDMGTQTYLDVLTPENAGELFEAAIGALLKFQQLPMTAPLPSYDTALLRRELELFPEWYVQRHLGVRFTEQQQALWNEASQLLIESALAQPTVLVHRDYMPRNLMVSTPNPGVLDFQDAVYGPVTYDITCLFKDAFLSWPQAFVSEQLGRYWERARAQGLPVQGNLADFLKASDLMGVQRHLKVIGIFARICHRDGKPRYLQDVPRFFAYIRAVTQHRKELAPLAQLLDSLPPATEGAP